MPLTCATEDEYRQQLKSAGKTLVVVDFYADWCGPCRLIAPFLAELEKTFEGKLIILKVNVDELEDLAQTEGIEAMPTFKLYREEKVIETFCGANKEKLKELIMKHK